MWIVGKGDVHLHLKSGSMLTLKDVWHIEKRRLNIVSIGHLDKDGYKCTIGDDHYKITKGNLVTAQGDLKDHLYRLKTKPSNAKVRYLKDRLNRRKMRVLPWGSLKNHMDLTT